MSFQDAVQLYRDTIKRFERIEGRPWGAEGAAIELSKQVGDLAKLVMLQEGYYCFDNEDPQKIRHRIADELGDIFGQLIRIADVYGIDLLQAHLDARAGEAKYLASRGV